MMSPTIYNRVVWPLRQLLPLHYRTGYTDSDGRRHYVVWRMWLGRVFAHDDVIVAPGSRIASRWSMWSGPRATRTRAEHRS